MGSTTPAPSMPDPILTSPSSRKLSEAAAAQPSWRGEAGGGLSSICRCTFAISILEELNQCQQLGIIKGNLLLPGQCKHLQPAIAGSSFSFPSHGLLVVNADFSSTVQIPLRCNPKLRKYCPRVTKVVQTPLWHPHCLSERHLLIHKTCFHAWTSRVQVFVRHSLRCRVSAVPCTKQSRDCEAEPRKTSLMIKGGCVGHP